MDRGVGITAAIFSEYPIRHLPCAWNTREMEHRWGERVGLNLPVRVVAHSFSVRTGKLTNLSVSGAYLKTEVDLRLLTRIEVAFDSPVRVRSEAPFVAAYITRKTADGVGLEWCEFAPPVVSALLKTIAGRRYSRIHTLETPAALNHAIVAEPLLRHGT